MIEAEQQLSHVGESGEANMVDVSDKIETKRVAIASSIVRMSPKTLEAILENEIQKGEVIAVARVAGIQAAKKCYLRTILFSGCTHYCKTPLRGCGLSQAF